MPLYDYRCTPCGDFRAMRPMSQALQDELCPGCGRPAPRLRVAPFLAGAGGGSSSAGQAGSGTRGGGNWRHLCGLGCRHAGCS